MAAASDADSETAASDKLADFRLNVVYERPEPNSQSRGSAGLPEMGDTAPGV